MNNSPVSVFLAAFSILACQLVVVSPSVAQGTSSDTAGVPAGKYLPVSGASDEALELTVVLACAPVPATETQRPGFGAAFSLVVFEPSSPSTAVRREVRLSSDGERVKTVTIPYALFGPGVLIATVEDFSLQGPCHVVSSLRQVETSGGRTRTDIKRASGWRANAFEIELGNTPTAQRSFDDGTSIPLSGSTDETMQFMFAAACVANTGDAKARDPGLSLRLVATEPTGAVSPVTVYVDLNWSYGSAAARQREHILLAQQVSVPYGHFYTRQSGPVLFQIRDVEVAPGCHMLPVIAQRADAGTGETKARNTPFIANYRPQFYFR